MKMIFYTIIEILSFRTPARNNNLNPNASPDAANFAWDGTIYPYFMKDVYKVRCW